MRNSRCPRWFIAAFTILTALGWITQAAAADAVKIGFIFSLTGPGAPIGKLQEQAVKLAVNEVNESGGIELGGKKVLLEAVIKDDETKPAQAAKVYQDLVKSGGATAVVGGTFAHTAMALNNEAKQNKAFLMLTCGISDDFFRKTVKAPTAACMIGGTADMGRAGITYIFEKMKAKRVACFLPGYALGQSLASVFEMYAKSHPDLKYEVFWHPVGSTDMRRDLLKLAEFKPDVVYVGSWGADAVNALDQISQLGLSKQAKIFHFWMVDPYAVNIPPETMKDLWSLMFWYHDMAGSKDETVVKASEDFSSKYAKAYKIPPDPYAMIAYCAVNETVRAMKSANSSDPDKMYAALIGSPDWTGPKGPAKWRADGRSVYKYWAWVIQGKGAEERTGSKYGKEYDFARIIDGIGGESFLPDLRELGY